MNDPDNYIELYFTGQLNDAEKKQFEERCVQDEVFAKEVAFYVTLRETLRQELLEQKKLLWANDENDDTGSLIRPIKKIMVNKWLAYVAAACLIILTGLYFLYKPETPQQFAEKYVKEQFTVLYQTMDPSKDSLQQGISAYNSKDYHTALDRFQKISQSGPQDGVAKKYTGLVYLVTKDYDKALQEFDELAVIKGLYRNPGLFLKAITLLQRNKDGDKANARQLLERVVKERTEGNSEAEKWLKKWQ